jgi:phospholipase A1
MFKKERDLKPNVFHKHSKEPMMSGHLTQRMVIMMFLLLSVPARSFAQTEARVGLIEQAWDSTPSAPRYALRTHEMNYFLPITRTSSRNIDPWIPFKELGLQEGDRDLDDIEAKFQISLRQRFWASPDHRLGLWFAYTQLSTWQIYNRDESHPFRDTNYRPELIASYNPRMEVLGFQWNLLNLGFVHESNGRAEVISRSWDRVYAEAGFERENIVLLPRVWHAISTGGDDNPDILDYYGYGQLTLYYRRGDRHLSLMGRGNLSKGKGAAQASLVSQPLIGTMRGYLQVFSGYGETMMDYNWNQTVVGIGITINPLF